tara:strand:+ start:625 stop:855 length:231 start_codon:yes stop_codon:yes gene_type:complete
MNNTKKLNVTYKVVEHPKFKLFNSNETREDFRVEKYLNGEWVNQRDGGWSKDEAEKIMNIYKSATKKGLPTMSDEF